MLSRRFLIPAALLGLGLSPAMAATDSKQAESPPAAAQMTAEQIVARNVSVRGGLQAWRAVEALSMSGKMEVGTGDSTARAIRVANGGKVTRRKVALQSDTADKDQAQQQVQLPFELELARPNKSRIEIEFAGKKAVQVYDGSRGWKLRPFLNRNDAEPFTQDEAKAESAKEQLDGPLVDYAAKGTKLALEGVEAVDGHDAYKLKLTLKSGKVQHVWIDTHSFLDVKVEGTPRRMDGKLHTVWVYQRDFRPIGGLMVPFQLETAVDGYRETHKTTISKVILNPKLAQTAFAKPGV